MPSAFARLWSRDLIFGSRRYDVARGELMTLLATTLYRKCSIADAQRRVVYLRTRMRSTGRSALLRLPSHHWAYRYSRSASAYLPSADSYLGIHTGAWTPPPVRLSQLTSWVPTRVSEQWS